jgi:hypothetical protein
MAGFEEASGWGWGEVPTEPEQPIIFREIYSDYEPKCTRPSAIHLETKMWNSNVRIFYSCPEVWELFFSTDHEIVSIDCEGVHPSNDDLPLLVQIASPTMVILQFPSDKEGYREEREGILPGDTIAGEKQTPPRYCDFLTRLLNDHEILKVMFDPKGNKRRLFGEINSLDLLETIGSSGLDLRDRYLNSLSLSDLLQITTGKLYETQSRKTTGWSSMRATKPMKHDKRFLIHAASNAWGILSCYLSLRKIFSNSEIEPPTTARSIRSFSTNNIE